MSEPFMLITNAACKREICRYFSQRGNGILRKLPAKVHPNQICEFLKEPCTACGEQMRVVTQPTENPAHA